VTQPRTVRPSGRIEDLDPLLTPEQSALLHLPAAVMATAWQEAQSCTDPGCVACRIGRAMAWATKAASDIGLSLDVLNGLIDLVPRDPLLGPRFQQDLAYVSLHEMERVVGELAYWGKNVGYACGLTTVDEEDPSVAVAVRQEDDGSIQASVLRKQPASADGADGKAN
jgi:hypothetical protein